MSEEVMPYQASAVGKLAPIPMAGGDAVVHPRHYNSHPSGVECITIVRHMGFNIGNVIKYCWRAGLKDNTTEIEDLKKARWYLDDEIKRREEMQGASQS